MATKQIIYGKILLSDDSKEFYMKCTFCLLSFNVFEEFKIHSKDSHIAQCNFNDDLLIKEEKFLDNCADEIKSEKLNQSEISNNEELHSQPCHHLCHYCNENFPFRYQRLEHELNNHGIIEKKYNCEICEKFFLKAINYVTHMKIHDGIKPYECDVCDSKFSFKTNLLVHKQRHSGIKRFRCQFCEKSFVSAVEKRNHERSHTGEKPFLCVECGSSFALASYLTEHKNQKHYKTKQIKCTNCEQYFTTKKAMRNHALVHKERKYKCKQCGTMFARSSNLRTHEKIHSDYRGYLCNLCGRGFKQQASLHSHMKCHAKKQI